MSNQIRFRTTADCVEVVPMLMGYAPDEQVTVTYCRQGRIVVTVALRLHYLATEGDSLRTPQMDADGVIVGGYSQNPEAVGSELARWYRETGLPGVVFVASPTHWAEVDPQTGEVGPMEARGTTTATVEAVVSGLPTPTLSREQKAATVLPNHHHSRGLLEAQAEAWNGERIEDACQRVIDSGQPMSSHDVRALAGALMDPQAFGQWWEDMTREQARRELRVWCEAATHYPDELCSVRVESEAERVLVAAGFTAWLAGDGVLQSTVRERFHARDLLGCLATEDMQLERAVLMLAHEMAVPPALWLADRTTD